MTDAELLEMVKGALEENAWQGGADPAPLLYDAADVARMAAENATLGNAEAAENLSLEALACALRGAFLVQARARQLRAGGT